MVSLDDNFLRECGLGELPASERRSLLGEAYAALELRVGTAISSVCTEFQLEEFSALIDRGAPESECKAWLEANVPDYPQAVDAAVADIRRDLILRASEILRGNGR
jgi:hypothetical protein